MRRYINLICLAVVFSAAIFSCSTEKKNPKYIFYFIGDGMGVAHVNATEAYLASTENRVGTKQLYMNQAPVHSTISTYSANKYITDSAAAGTALATGKKTSNGTISMDADRKNPITTVAEKAKAKGMKVGIVTSVYLNHATPAAFFAHAEERNLYYDIAVQLPKSNFDYFAGGDIHYATGKKGDKKSAIKIAQEAGYKYIRNNKEILALKKGDTKIIAVPEECPTGDAMPYAIDKDADDIKLAQLVEKGIEVLDNDDKGFFMMCEGGKIDWAAHGNDIATVIGEVIDFDNAVKVALEFYKKHPEETLIIVTADHETGGLGLGSYDTGYEAYYKNISEIKSSIANVLHEIEPMLADKKVKDHEIMKHIEDQMGFATEHLALSKEEEKRLEEAIDYKRNKAKKAKNYMYKNADNSPIETALKKIITKKTGFGWTTSAHTGVRVPIKTFGAKSFEFSGYMDNCFVPTKLSEYIQAN